MLQHPRFVNVVTRRCILKLAVILVNAPGCSSSTFGSAVGCVCALGKAHHAAWYL
jgi:hypothetical protein